VYRKREPCFAGLFFREYSPKAYEYSICPGAYSIGPLSIESSFIFGLQQQQEDTLLKLLANTTGTGF